MMNLALILRLAAADKALHQLTHDEQGRVLPDEAIDPEDIEALMREWGQ